MSSITESSTHTAHDSHAKPRPPPPPTDIKMQNDPKHRTSLPSNSQHNAHPTTNTGRPTRPDTIINGPSSTVHTRTEHRPISNNNNVNNTKTTKIPFGSRSVEVSIKLFIHWAIE
jgi:hypothetical protein